MYPYRTRFKKDIVAEFLPPAGFIRAPKKWGKRPNKVIIFCMGMPSGGNHRPLIEFFSKKGFWFFQPRYRGSWESGGKFLRLSPERDVLDIIGQLPKGFKDLYRGTTYRVKPDKLYVFGTSFGGPAALLASRARRVTKVVALSPVTDWEDMIRHGETNSWTERFTRNAFGEAYRFSHRDWKKLDNGTFYNPMAHASEIDGKKILIMHAKEDDVVRWRPVQRFAKLTGAKLVLSARGGHGWSMWFTKPRFYRKIARFLREPSLAKH